MSKRSKTLAWPGDFLWSEDRAFRDLFRDFFSSPAVRDRFVDGLTNPLHVEEFADGDTEVIRIELAGVDPDHDVQLEVADGVLSVRAQREERKEEKRPDGYRTEFRYGSFHRSIPLPDGASVEDIKASYQKGILEVRVPVTAGELKETPKQIAIEHK
jgi:HSP20 family protein